MLNLQFFSILLSNYLIKNRRVNGKISFFGRYNHRKLSNKVTMTESSSTKLIKICPFEIKDQFCNEFEFRTHDSQVVLNEEINQETVDRRTFDV